MKIVVVRSGSESKIRAAVVCRTCGFPICVACPAMSCAAWVVCPRCFSVFYRKSGDFDCSLLLRQSEADFGEAVRSFGFCELRLGHGKTAFC